MHRLLQRQLKRNLGESAAIEDSWRPLLEAISHYYQEIDREREFIENSLEVNSAELTELNERLRAHNSELLHTMMNTLSEGVYATDVNGHITFMNYSAEQILGRDEREMIGHKAEEILHHACPGGDAHVEKDCPLCKASWLGVSSTGEEYFIHRDGHATPISYRSNPLKQEGKLLGSLVSFSDISDRLKSEEKIFQLAFFDPLTHLPNRRLLLDRLGQAMAVSARQQMYGAVLFIDLDHFKDINDTLGHEFGDAILNEMALRLRAELREEDTVARLGGDEFVVILEGLDRDRSVAAAYAQKAGEKILEAARKPVLIRGKECGSSASIGIVLFRGHDQGLNGILMQSDLAMYNAKNVGRNVLSFFDPAMQQELERRTQLEFDLSHALAEKQFQLYFQRRVDQKGKVKGAEALLRWVRSGNQVVSPLDFIPLCEKTGLIVSIGRWVLQEACRQLKAWENSPKTRNLLLSINVSAREFKQEAFVAQVKDVLRETGANPALLELEITESMLLENIEELIRKMRALSEIGITFSLDDFGTGYSSLSYLKKLPLHKLKIDQSFIRDVGFDKNDEAIVRTILQIGKTLGLEVIAEGVETDSHRQKLAHLGCRHYQGYLFGRPIPIQEFCAGL